MTTTHTTDETEHIDPNVQEQILDAVEDNPLSVDEIYETIPTDREDAVSTLSAMVAEWELRITDDGKLEVNDSE